MRTEDQVDTGAGPLDLVRLAVAPLVHISRAVGVIRRLPLRAHVEQVDEEVVGQRTGLLSEDSMLGVAGVCSQDAQATDEDRHLRRGQLQQLRTIDQHLLCREALLAAQIVAESICLWFERLEGFERRFALATRPCGLA